MDCAEDSTAEVARESPASRPAVSAEILTWSSLAMGAPICLHFVHHFEHFCVAQEFRHLLDWLHLEHLGRNVRERRGILAHCPLAAGFAFLLISEIGGNQQIGGRMAQGELLEHPEIRERHQPCPVWSDPVPSRQTPKDVIEFYAAGAAGSFSPTICGFDLNPLTLFAAARNSIKGGSISSGENTGRERTQSSVPCSASPAESSDAATSAILKALAFLPSRTTFSSAPTVIVASSNSWPS